MGKSSLKGLSWLITGVLAVGILPSLTAISNHLYRAVGISGELVGPINPLKLTLPFLAIFLGLNFRRIREFISNKIWIALTIGYAIGTFSVLWGASRCEWSPMLLRDWMLHIASAMWGIAFLLLEKKQQRVVLFSWLGWVVTSCLMDWLAPSFQDWLFNNVFDPQTRAYDPLEVGEVLTGIFGRQSLAKLLAWTPWFFALLLPRTEESPKKHFYFVAGMTGVLVCSGLVLATSQRGPFVSILAAALLILVLYARREGLQRQTIGLLIFGFLVCAGSLTVLFVPQPILESRVRSLVGLPPTGFLGRQAEQNIDFRRNMMALNWEVIRENPMGKACFPDPWFFWHRGTMVAHAHHIFLQEYRARGWLWGTFHMLLWLAVGWFLYRSLPLAWENIFWFGAYLSIFFTGQFDYPWMALSQSIVLWIVLWKGLSLGSKRSYGKA
jgi:hypothetical protein